MGKIKFVSNEGNFTAKGYVLNEVYETGPRTESGKNPGKFFYNVTGKNVPATGLNEWETNLFLYFKFPSNSEEAKTANAYLESLKGITATPGTQVASPVQTAPIQQTAPVQQQATAPAAHIPVQQPSTLENGTTNPDYLLKGAEIKIKIQEKDVLLAGLTNLDFQSLNLKLLKLDGKISMVIIVDGMPPLAINSGNISAAELVAQIVSTFSESFQIVSTIREWNKSLKELQSNTEEKLKKAKEANAKADQPVEAAAAKSKRATKNTILTETTVPNEPVGDDGPVDKGPDPEMTPDMPDNFGDDLPEPSEGNGLDESNGLDQDVEEFQLK